MEALGRYIVMLGFAGARNALTLAELHREEVQKRFPKHFLKQEDELRSVINKLTGLADAQKVQNAEVLMRQAWSQEQQLSEVCRVALQENEVFPALWKLAEGLDAGLDVELQKIPVLQFVIEVSELFDVNPYVNMTALENRNSFRECIRTTEKNQSATYGFLVATDKPEALIAFAEANGLPSAIIGRLTGKNDRVVRNGEIIRYLTPEG